MPHTDATGYIEDLRREIDKPWFSLLCQKAVIDGLGSLDNASLDEVYSVLIQATTYPGYPASSAAAAIATPATTVDYLESLASFSNFKLLSATLNISFTKPISLIFGTNGSGKSSVCDALKVLATSTAPERPLENVRATPPGVPGFSFKFRSDGAPQPWQEANGYGLRQQQVKHFDTAVAIGNLQNSVEPGRVVELSPFKLYLFEVLKGMLVALRDKLQSAKQANESSIALALADVRRAFDAFDASPLRTITEEGLGTLDAEINKGAIYADDALLKIHREKEAELVKGTSEQGLKLLQAEHREGDTLHKNLVRFITTVDAFWKADVVGLNDQLATKQKEQLVVGETLLPKGATLSQLLALVRPAAAICDLDNAEGEECPLCRQDLGEPELELFKKYHELLSSNLEQDIQGLRNAITSAVSLHDSLEPFRDLAWVKGASAETLAGLTKALGEVLTGVTLVSRPTAKGKDALAQAQSTTDMLAGLLASKQQTISTATNDRNSLLEQLRLLHIEIQRLEYAKLAFAKLAVLKDVKIKADWKRFFEQTLPGFTTLARKLTEAAKSAYDELVIADFKTRLEAEYLALTEQPMSTFGVTLVPRGSDAAVTLLPQIGGREIRTILSEGEQRIHALALFFAEIETCKHSVIVLDDPVSSFDYNYVGNFCNRLRDWYKSHPGKQIIILAHSWDFFVQVQAVLKRDNLDPSLSVMVMENCSIVGDYTEKITELKAEIETFLALPPEPSKQSKEVAAGKMRRLIEAVVNTHVFNHQRHQFKQKTLKDSVFQLYTKLVPLLDTEATTLRDLYGKLSTSEHDDPRNAYVNSTQAVFQTRYDQIIAVEAAIVSRK